MSLNSTMPVSTHTRIPALAARRTRSALPPPALARASRPRHSPQASAGTPNSSAASSSRPKRRPDNGPIRASSRVGEDGTIGILSRSDWVASG